MTPPAATPTASFSPSETAEKTKTKRKKRDSGKEAVQAIASSTPSQNPTSSHVPVDSVGALTMTGTNPALVAASTSRAAPQTTTPTPTPASKRRVRPSKPRSQPGLAPPPVPAPRTSTIISSATAKDLTLTEADVHQFHLLHLASLPVASSSSSLLPSRGKTRRRKSEPSQTTKDKRKGGQQERARPIFSRPREVCPHSYSDAAFTNTTEEGDGRAAGNGNARRRIMLSTEGGAVLPSSGVLTPNKPDKKGEEKDKKKKKKKRAVSSFVFWDEEDQPLPQAAAQVQVQVDSVPLQGEAEAGAGHFGNGEEGADEEHEEEAEGPLFPDSHSTPPHQSTRTRLAFPSRAHHSGASGSGSQYDQLASSPVAPPPLPLSLSGQPKSKKKENKKDKEKRDRKEKEKINPQSEITTPAAATDSPSRYAQAAHSSQVDQLASSPVVDTHTRTQSELMSSQLSSKKHAKEKQDKKGRRKSKGDVDVLGTPHQSQSQQALSAPPSQQEHPYVFTTPTQVSALETSTDAEKKEKKRRKKDHTYSLAAPSEDSARTANGIPTDAVLQAIARASANGQGEGEGMVGTPAAAAERGGATKRKRDSVGGKAGSRPGPGWVTETPK